MTSKCPSCGAPATPGAITCRYCNSPLAGPPQAPRAHPPTSGNKTLLFVVASTLLIMAIGSGVGFWASVRGDVASPAVAAVDGTPMLPRERPSSLLAAIPAADGNEDVIVSFYADDKYHLGRVDGDALTIAWKSEFGNKSSIATVVASDTLAFVANGERLAAHDLADGKRRWEVGLVAELNARDNLRRVGDSVIAWQKDKSLQAFDAATGAVRWSRRTSDTHDQLAVVAGKLVVEAEGDPKKFTLVDPATGVAGPPVYVACDHRHNSWIPTYDDLQQIETAPDDHTLVLAMGSTDLCLAAWDATTGKTLWTAQPKADVRVGWFDRKSLLVDTTGVYLAGSDVLLALDLASGHQRDVVREADSEFRLRFVHEGTLVALSWPDYDSGKLTLRALAPEGTPRWQHRLTATDNSGRDWGVAPGPGAVFVWQSSDDDKVVIVERIDIKTGTVLDRKPVTPPGMSPSAPWIFAQLATAKRAWLLASGDFATIDLVTGAAEHI